MVILNTRGEITPGAELFIPVGKNKCQSFTGLSTKEMDRPLVLAPLSFVSIPLRMLPTNFFYPGIDLHSYNPSIGRYLSCVDCCPANHTGKNHKNPFQKPSVAAYHSGLQDSEK